MPAQEGSRRLFPLKSKRLMEMAAFRPRKPCGNAPWEYSVGILRGGAPRIAGRAGTSRTLAQPPFAGASHGKVRGHPASDRPPMSSAAQLRVVDGFDYLLFFPLTLLTCCHFDQNDCCYPWLFTLFSYELKKKLPRICRDSPPGEWRDESAEPRGASLPLGRVLCVHWLPSLPHQPCGVISVSRDKFKEVKILPRIKRVMQLEFSLRSDFGAYTFFFNIYCY